jgi:hypothetical protein
MALLVSFWNLENLFAPEGFPGREPWLAEEVGRELQGWTEQLFRTKVSQLCSIISRLKAGAGPDLLGVCEVENRFALQAVADGLNVRLPARRYEVVHADAARDQRGIDTAFIVDTAVLTAKPGTLFSHWVMRRTGTRDITQSTFVTNTNREIVALVNHWPSRSGGTYESRGYRMTAGETLGYWHERIREEVGIDRAVIALGDFNDDPFDESVTRHARAGRERGDVIRATSAQFYNLSWRYLSQVVKDRNGNSRDLDGTLYFGGDGNVFDQIFVSASLLTGRGGFTVVEQSARVEAFPEMVDHRVGEGPIRFGLPKGNPAQNINLAGYSDHFPVSVAIEETP